MEDDEEDDELDPAASRRALSKELAKILRAIKKKHALTKADVEALTYDLFFVEVLVKKFPAAELTKRSKSWRKGQRNFAELVAAVKASETDDAPEALFGLAGNLSYVKDLVEHFPEGALRELEAGPNEKKSGARLSREIAEVLSRRRG